MAFITLISQGFRRAFHTLRASVCCRTYPGGPPCKRCSSASCRAPCRRGRTGYSPPDTARPPPHSPEERRMKVRKMAPKLREYRRLSQRSGSLNSRTFPNDQNTAFEQLNYRHSLKGFVVARNSSCSGLTVLPGPSMVFVS